MGGRGCLVRTPQPHFRLAVSLVGLGRHADAIPHFRKAEKLGTHNGCVVLESYTAPGYAGQSFNIYDRSQGQWHQTWVDTSGGLHAYWGGVKDGSMVYEGSIPPAPSQTARSQTRMTLFRVGPDTVRQLAETTPDNGKTWQTVYDLTYVRKK